MENNDGLDREVTAAVAEGRPIFLQCSSDLPFQTIKFCIKTIISREQTCIHAFSGVVSEAMLYSM